MPYLNVSRYLSEPAKKGIKKIKVAFFADILTVDFDGAVRTMYQLIHRIDAARFDYLFIYGEGPESILNFRSFQIPALSLPVNTNYSIAIPLLAKGRLIKKLQAFNPDVVHIATPSFLGSFGLDYACRAGLPVISIYHTHFISYVDYYFKRAPLLIKHIKQQLTKAHKSFYNRCDKVYVPSESIRNELTEMGIYPDSMKIWKRGVDTALFSPYKKDKRRIQKLVGNKNPTVIFASRLVWEKNLETLFNIYNKLQALKTPVNLLIVGNGTARQACEVKMPNAVFTNDIDHEYLSVLYASADVFLFPSVSETYGNVVIEAMASGLPCVIADGGGSKDFIDQGVNGFKCSPYNADEYVEKIELLLHNRQLSASFAANGLQYCKHLSWDELAGVYFNDISNLAFACRMQLVSA
ncbi:glycosyltransferase family 1 protein [Mucilaginibacter sp. AK015]|uniref:glycosyltransferase family 4 protein n=1 Tax=Mucilaginibacter sp. AK015 TaxID=2723072 RepID=UPI00160A65D5|nr:glycosyltransferase family 1 protein [Mucilaginibacter sp. AK015]MBB5395002.1 glycosyltransferase involved in cell wall biosynthesis [Mucilaginibacter sp. AK015]